MIALGIDAGASSSRWLLLDDDREVARGRGAPITGHVFTDAARAKTLEHVVDLCRAVVAHRTPERVVAGITGLDRGGEAAGALAAAFAEGLGIGEECVIVMNDMDVAYRAVFVPGAGVLVYGGTGSIAYYVSADDAPDGEPSSLRVGGHGYLIDDAGGGFWIGRQALQWVVRERDRLGEAPSATLAKALYTHAGSDDWGALREHVYGGGRQAVAAFAAVVGEAAQRGDPKAEAILMDAGTELARLALVAFERLGRRLPVRLAGGVVNLGEPLVAAFREALPVGLDVAAVTIEPVEAAARLALDHA